MNVFFDNICNIVWEDLRNFCQVSCFFLTFFTNRVLLSILPLCIIYIECRADTMPLCFKLMKYWPMWLKHCAMQKAMFSAKTNCSVQENNFQCKKQWLIWKKRKAIVVDNTYRKIHVFAKFKIHIKRFRSQ